MSNASTRLGLAWAGVVLWLAYPMMSWSGRVAAFQYECRRKPAVNGSDPCFTDYLPFLEMLAFPITVLLAYPFARFAFTLFAPPPSDRGASWRIAGSSAGSDYYPTLQLAAALGIGWALFHGAGYPFALYTYLTYWAAWIAWFGLGIWMSWPSTEPD